MKSVLFFLAFLGLLSLCHAVSLCDNGVTLSGGVCSCYSGWTGSICNVSSIGSCLTPTVNPMVTEAVAEFMTSQSSISNDIFQFVIETPARRNRYISSVVVNSNNCNFPSSSASFVKGFDTSTCQDSITGSFAVEVLTQTCQFATSSVGNDFLVSGFIDITTVDPLPALRGVPLTRTTTASLGVELSLPNFVNFTTVDLVVTTPIQVLAAVTSQMYDVMHDNGTISLTTSVQWPYMLDSPMPELHPNINVMFGGVDDSGCTSVVNSPCTQVWTFVLSGAIVNGLCSLDGNYTFGFNYTCNAAFSPCPVTQASIPSAINIELASENLCGHVTVVSHVSGSISSFADKSFTTPQTAFIANHPMYFLVSVQADASIISVSVVNVRVVMGGNTLTLVSGGTSQIPSIGYSPSSGLPSNEAGFSFIGTYGPSSNFVFMAGQNTYVFQVSVDVQITYRTTFSKKRDVETQVLTFAKDMIVLPENPMIKSVEAALAPNSASTATYGAASVVAAAAIGAVLLI